ncbi:SDR family NAD(P)-dependent oxidoreductase [Desulfobaculum bizertense]|uniref:Polysaccharide biosynthesis protein n=1 Tax=Desulfobaculum bizertense DSM 18034 TaxID=1121442 RepID=A0A1T4VQI9_9BACT|nr:SDR family NAD(P)-dependent oxidoreductase [Desulfobaculum bizertense]SKA67253.1 Polysaccharide biosynthesis protein [Desulfobaculum bizertense DSM 18034]
MQSLNLRNKRVLVTGACGTIGKELIRQLLEDYGVGELIGIDNNESELFFVDQIYGSYENAHFYLGDIRDISKLTKLTKGIDIVFHTAALKHVILCEKSPYESVQTNILGIKNVIDAALECNVEKVIFTSSDKAVNPTNVMGTSKLMGERLITAANSLARDKRTILASTRFGNVLGSRGSVIPIFREQIKSGKNLSLTHPEMTRFIMSIDEATKLVIDSCELAQGGGVFVTKMPVIRIKDLAEVMIQELAPVYGHNPEDIGITVIGSKPGEKLYEELMSEEEMARTVELEKYFAVTPAFRCVYRHINYEYPGTLSKTVTRPYNSANETPLTQVELKDFLYKNNLLFETAS